MISQRPKDGTRPLPLPGQTDLPMGNVDFGSFHPSAWDLHSACNLGGGRLTSHVDATM